MSESTAKSFLNPEFHLNFHGEIIFHSREEAVNFGKMVSYLLNAKSIAPLSSHSDIITLTRENSTNDELWEDQNNKHKVTYLSQEVDTTLQKVFVKLNETFGEHLYHEWFSGVKVLDGAIWKINYSQISKNVMHLTKKSKKEIREPLHEIISEILSKNALG